MNLSDCLPEYFSVKTTGGYYVYQNTVYESSDTRNIPASVIWPIVNASFGSMTQYMNTSSKKQTLTRKWNSDEYYPCFWIHDGLEIEMTKANGVKIHIPVISFVASNYDILPYNNTVLNPTSTIPGISTRRGIDIKARFFTTDPVDSVPGLNIRKKTPVVVSIPLATIPTHVKQILIADAVRNKTDCPISCEPITLTNSAVTSCGHVFIADEIKTWLSMISSKGLCPSCKQNCSI